MPTTGPRRLPSETYSVPLRHISASGEERTHDLDITVGFLVEGERWIPHEVVFTGRGIIGQGMDQLLVDLGIALSRAIQGRSPDTGEAL